MRPSNTTIVDFYQGAYGPTLRIDVQDASWLKAFQSHMAQLANRNITEFDLLHLDGVEKGEISGLRFRLDFESSLTIVTPKQTGKYESFLWTLDMESIERITDVVDRFLESNRPGHYYLYDEDQTLVELAFKE